MTAVARLAINNYPLLIGDVLLSAPEVPGQFVSVPIIGDITTVFPEGSGCSLWAQAENSDCGR